MFALLSVWAVRAASVSPTRPSSVDLIRIDGSINPAVASFLEDALAAAQGGGASALVIELDTLGGLMTSAERMVKDILGAEVPVIVYVAPSGAKAASAGTFITLAANIAAMAPATTIGAAHPVTETGGNVRGAMGVKIENFAASFARSIARARGRNERWAEDAVRHSAMIGENEALAKHVIDIVAPDLPALLTRVSGRTVIVAGHPVTLQLKDATVHLRTMTFGQSMFNTLSDPNLVYLLLIAGLLGLYFEFAHPGVFFPGVAGSICLLLALASFEVLPVTLSGLLLILSGVAMLVAEAFITSYGVLGIGGVVSLVLGSLLLIDTSKTNVAVSHGLVYGVAGAFSAIVLLTGFLVVRERRRAATTGSEGLIGAIGEVRSPMSPGMTGTVFIHGELWRARSNEALPTGARVRVRSVYGLEIEVTRTE